MNAPATAGTGRFKNQVALVTGAASGIGRGVAEALAVEGARVAVNHPPDERQQAEAESVCRVIENAGGNTIAVQADVADERMVDDMVRRVEHELGPISILINCAGVASSAPVEQLEVAEWDRVISIHLRGTFLCTRAVLPGMYRRDYGKIVNTASQLAYKGAAGFSHYTAAKGAILSFTRSVALEVGARNINVNAVAPGATRTPMLRDVPQETLEAVRASIPKGRLAEVSDIVPTYLFLASDQARHFVGQCLSPNGGDVFL